MDKDAFKPTYLQIDDDEFRERIKTANDILEDCVLCPRRCRVNRLAGDLGECQGGALVKIASAHPHFGEEPVLVGRYGSGTIFFSNCNLRCIFCQNYDISHYGSGEEISAQQLANVMLALQGQGCHNINIVTPTHYAPQLMEAMHIASKSGLRIPLVYNCGGYESLQVLKLLDGIVDIYMPDFKFADNDVSRRFCGVDDYFEAAKAALGEMHRQVGDLKVNTSGIAERGLLIRHLVMPDDLAGSEKVLAFIAEEISKDSYVNIMAQYRPCYKAYDDPGINRHLAWHEHEKAMEIARKLGLHRGF